MPRNHFRSRSWRAAIAAPLMVLLSAPALADDLGLVMLMERLQTYAHKLQLSVEARNAPLAGFYLHELEETVEVIAENIPHYDEHPVGELARDMLLPTVERLEDSVDASEWVDTDANFLDLVRACNACHLVTGHGFVRIAPATGNPYAQDFAVVED
jgi:hypothetical protein